MATSTRTASTTPAGAIKTDKDGTPSGDDGKPLEGTHSTDVRENTEDERKVQPRESGKAQVDGSERPYTVVDGNGIERIVTNGRRNWKPRPSEPHPELVKRAKAREKAAEKLAKERKTPVSER